MLAIDVDALATRLQDEGATLFVNAQHERMANRVRRVVPAFCRQHARNQSVLQERVTEREARGERERAAPAMLRR